MQNNLPWGLIFIGVFIAIVVEIIGIPVLPFAIGVYLPVQLNACIMVGGLIRLFFEKMKESKRKKGIINDGILYCSGMIAGEGLVGIILAVLAIIPFTEEKSLAGMIDLTEKIQELGLPAWASSVGSLVVFALIILSLLAGLS